MGPRRRTTAIAAVAALAVAAVAVAGARSGGGGGGARTGDDRGAAHDVVGPEGAVLERPGVAVDVRTRPPGAGCDELALAGYTPECGDAGDLTWVVERRPDTAGVRVSVLARDGAETWRVVLEAVDDGPAGPVRFAAVGVAVGDVSGDGAPELVFGFRNQGSGAILDVDVVDARGHVVVHRSLDKGRAVLGDGRLDEWAALPSPEDPVCCPSRYVHRVVRRVDGAWRIEEERVVASGEVPEGLFT